jgi:molybdenum cofactor cytidylyltransferase
LISAIVLAAGRSTRMGRNKLVLSLDGKPVLQRVLDALKDSKVDETLVVLGGGAEEVRSTVDLGGTKVVVNRRYAQGMSTSIRAGLARVDRSTDAAIIVLGDQPFLSAALVNAVIDAFQAEGAPVVLPVHRGTRGNPVLFARSVFPEIMRIGGDRGAKSVVEAHEDDVLEVKAEDAGAVIDVDTPSDYERATLLSRQVKQRRTRGTA